MKFIDETKILLEGGKGGNGLISFNFIKNKSNLIPNGGNGGNGGNIWIKCNKKINTLINFKYKKNFKAQNGKNGKNFNKKGKNGKNLFLEVPIGTKIKDIKNNIWYKELKKNNDKLLIVKGGLGGLGNKNFKKKNITYSDIYKGKIGEKKYIYIKIIIFSEIGLLGLPNSGKSTFLSKNSNSKTKIDNYNFTTLYPELGITFLTKKKKFSITDIPGIIKNSYKNKGLGIKFLKHLKKTKLILYIIDITNFFIYKNNIKYILKILFNLKKYKMKLFNKPKWIIINKIDKISNIKIIKIISLILLKLKINLPIYKISSIKKKNNNKLIYDIYNFLN
ncbi:putative Obg family GTPase CgtA [Candidatus Zinderia insecticola CARI]|uniref:Putative Obg family GTPase CgtA n=1 Tax=Zinderia insecticola (strain CARI) TaxID=871271 RepID=E0TJ04_ZINIC|nr:putative Obg family GTPase CgtA [Candidatus Zinderia insecticola CARI]